MAATPSPEGSADTHRSCHGRSPLPSKSSHKSTSLDCFLKTGSSSSATDTSDSSASATACDGPGGCENRNPNVEPFLHATPKSENYAGTLGSCDANSETDVTVDLKHVSASSPGISPSPSPEAACRSSTMSPSSGRSDSALGTVDADLNPDSMANLCAADPSAVFIPTSNVKRRSCKKRIREPNPCAGKSVESSLSNGPSTEIASKSAIKVPKRGLKRKCILPSGRLDAEHSLTLVKELQSEVSSLINFYHEDGKIDLTAVNVQNAGRRAEIALLVEESGLPFSSLVANILLQLKTSTESHDGSDLTPAALRSTVLSIGERISFGTPNPDADVLEDDSDTCLWCWEIRDVKLLPESFRDMVLSRRRKRRKIAERIAALSGLVMLGFDK